MVINGITTRNYSKNLVAGICNVAAACLLGIHDSVHNDPEYKDHRAALDDFN
jgi:hypothetical protein